MNNRNKLQIAIGIWFIILAAFVLLPCNKLLVPTELLGQWKSNERKITVRTEPRSMKFEFASDTAITVLTININRTVSGNIGQAKFENARMVKNVRVSDIIFGSSGEEGITYVIKCGAIGKIFPTDPLNSKEVQFWLSPVNSNGTLEAELRYTENGATFPMAGMLFTKVTK